MGVVYKIKNEATNDPTSYALKTFIAGREWGIRTARRFEREALTWLQLDKHPNIVQALWVERVEGLPCLIMEYIPEGTTLKDVLGEHTRSAKGALRLALNLCDGLGYAHSRLGILHRDVKPENCLIAGDGSLKIADFGISLAWRGEILDQNAGTPKYRAPEQSDPTLKPDERVDVYAFGITLTEILAGQCLTDATEARMRARQQEKNPLWALALRCIDENRENRPRTFVHVRASIEQCHAEIIGSAAPSPPSVPDPTPEEYQDKAAGFVALQQFPLAVRAYERALNARPSNPALWAGLSAVHFQMEQPELAIEAAEKGLSLGRATSSLLNNKGQALAALGRLDDALTALRDASALDPTNPIIWCNMADLLWKKEKRAEAFELCKVSLKIDPKYVRALVLKANLLLESDRVPEAQGVLDEARRINPSDPEVLFGMSWVLDKQHRTEEALAQLEMALAFQDENFTMLRQYGWLLLKAGRLNDALSSLTRVLNHDPSDAEALRGKVLVLLAQGERQAAMESVNVAEQFHPTNPRILELRGLVQV